MGFGERLVTLRKERKISQDKLAKAVGVSRSAISQYEIGMYEPNIDTLNLIAATLNVSVEELLSDKRTLEKPVKMVPVTANASCGAVDISSLQDFTRKAYYNGEFWKESLYCVIANGESMSPEIDNGDEVIIDPEIEATSGDMVLYKLDDEYAIKVLVIDEDAHLMQFIPYNSSDEFKTRTIRIDDEDTMNRLVIHKVVSVNKLMFNNRAARLKMIGR